MTFVSQTNFSGKHPYKKGYIGLRQWSYDTSVNKTFSNSYDLIQPVEIIFSKEVISTDEGLRKVLREGIEIPEVIGSNILFVFKENENENNYEALFLELKKLKVRDNKYYFPNNCSDMSHVMHTLRIYTIDKSNMFSTEKINKTIPLNDENKIRYFYCKLIFEEHTNNDFKLFHLFSLNEYYKTFFRRYLKTEKSVLKLSNSQITALTDLVGLIQTKSELYKKFLSCTGYTDSEINQALTSLSEQSIAHLKEQYALSDLIQYLLTDKTFKEECVDEGRRSWLSEKTDEQTELLENIEALIKRNEELAAMNQRLESENKSLNDKFDFLNSSLQTKTSELQMKNKNVTELEHKKKKLQKDIENEINLFKDNLAHTVAISYFSGFGAVSSSLNNINITTTAAAVSGDGGSEKDMIIDRSDSNMLEMPNQLLSIDEFLQCLSDNLKSLCAIKKEYRENVSKLMAAELSIHGNFVIYGTKSSDIADCISITMYSEYAAKVILPLNIYNMPSMLNEINSIGNNVIFIENAFDGNNDCLALALLRRKSNKHFIFSVNNKNTFNFLHESNIWEYSVYLNFDDIMDRSYDYKICPGLYVFPSSGGIENISSHFDNKYKGLLDIARVSSPLKRHLGFLFDSYERLGFSERDIYYGVELVLRKMADDNLLRITPDELDSYLRSRARINRVIEQRERFNKLKEIRREIEY